MIAAEAEHATCVPGTDRSAPVDDADPGADDELLFNIWGNVKPAVPMHNPKNAGTKSSTESYVNQAATTPVGGYTTAGATSAGSRSARKNRGKVYRNTSSGSQKDKRKRKAKSSIGF